MLEKTSLSQRISLMLLGFFLTIVILEIGLRIGGFTILSIQEYRNLQSIKQKSSFRIMCLGESTTQNQYPHYLEEVLNKRNIGIKFSVIDKGIAGTNTGVILSELEANLDKYYPDMVITMMGINDEGPHIPYEAAYTSKIILTIRSFKAYKLARLLWLHIATKFKEKGFYASASNNQAVRKLPNHVTRDKFREIHQQQEFFQQEQIFKNAIELNPNNDSAYVELGRLYRDQGKLAESEQELKNAIELNPNNDFAYKQLGRLYRFQGKLTEAEQSLKNAIELNPNNDSVYIELGWFYQSQEKFAESEQAFKKAIELNPNNDSAYVELGWFYKVQGRLAELEETFKKAIELNPNNDSAYIELGGLYQSQEKFAESEQAFKKAIELNPNNDSAYRKIGWFYRVQGKFTEAKQLLKNAIKLNPNNECLYGSLAIIYCEIGNNELSEVYAKKAESLRNKYLNPNTINNYQALKQILDKKKIKLICMQYPMRNIKPLKKIFKEEMEDSIVFVDNEKIFKDAIRKKGYKEYFTDAFAEDFGHCTTKGNMLLAENIASVILKEVFDK